MREAHRTNAAGMDGAARRLAMLRDTDDARDRGDLRRIRKVLEWGYDVGDRLVVQHAIEKIGDLGAPEAGPYLLEIAARCENDDVTARYLVRALDRLDDARACDLLTLWLTRHGDRAVRSACALALARNPHPSAKASLDAALFSSNPYVREVALSAAKMFGLLSEETRQRLRHDPNVRVRIGAWTARKRHMRNAAAHSGN